MYDELVGRVLELTSIIDRSDQFFAARDHRRIDRVRERLRTRADVETQPTSEPTNATSAVVFAI